MSAIFACQTAALCMLFAAATATLPTAEGEPAERPSPLQGSPAMGSVLAPPVMASGALGGGPRFGGDSRAPSWLSSDGDQAQLTRVAKQVTGLPTTEELDPGPVAEDGTSDANADAQEEGSTESDAMTTMFGASESEADGADEPAPTLADTDDDREQDEPETTEADTAEAVKKITAYKQSVAEFDYATGSWLPARDQASQGWQSELQVPQQLIDCNCDGRVPGRACRVWRSYVKPTDPSVDQKCVACVKEPCIDYETVEEMQQAVVYRCFETEEPFVQEGCESGEWFHKKGTKRLRKLYPCKVKVPIKYQKPVVSYRDVWYYIQCDSAEQSY